MPNRKILAYDVAADSKALKNKRVLIDAGPGTPDGMRCDIDGNLWCGWGIGQAGAGRCLHLRARRRTDRPHHALPERCANVCFGGVKRNRLFMASSQSIYAVYVNTQGALGGLTGTPPSQRHCERSEAIQSFHACGLLDCRVASLLAMTAERPS